MPIATIRPIGDGLYHIHVLEGAVDPGYGRPGGGFDRPDQGLPGGGHISNRPPGSWEGRPDNSLPGQGGHPGNRPPGSGNPSFPDNSLPSGPPPHVQPGATLILVRAASGTWHYAAIQPGQPVPPPIATQPPMPGTGLPGGPPPTAGTPLPPTGQPKAT